MVSPRHKSQYSFHQSYKVPPQTAEEVEERVFGDVTEETASLTREQDVEGRHPTNDPTIASAHVISRKLEFDSWKL